MLIKPDLKDEEIIRCLRDAYGLDVKATFFLPIGADFSTAVYRVTISSGADYFLKLRSGEFFEASVLVPKYLADLGLTQTISPIATMATGTEQFWTSLDTSTASFKVILYPYVDGCSGLEAKLSGQQWIEFGVTMKKFHSIDIPPTITNDVPRETFSSKWRETVKAFRGRIENEAFEEPVAVKMAEFLKSKSTTILKFIERTENLAITIQKHPFEYILCHADIHGWNLMVDTEGALYIVDWDTLIFAPKERDLMFVGAGISNSGRPPIEEENLFYQGYGQTEVDQDAICYYRFERIIEDIGEYCAYIFLSDKGGDDRIQVFEHLQSNFLPNGTIERAYQSDKMRKVL